MLNIGAKSYLTSIEFVHPNLVAITTYSRFWENMSFSDCAVYRYLLHLPGRPVNSTLMSLVSRSTLTSRWHQKDKCNYLRLHISSCPPSPDHFTKQVLAWEESMYRHHGHRSCVRYGWHWPPYRHNNNINSLRQVTCTDSLYFSIIMSIGIILSVGGIFVNFLG